MMEDEASEVAESGSETATKAGEEATSETTPVDDSTAASTDQSTSTTTAAVSDTPVVEATPACVDHSAESSHLFSDSWTTLPKDVLIDKIKGVIYGQAIGDAFGLATEFMTRKEAKKHYKKGPSGYSDIIWDPHRNNWEKGDWTDDTDQMLLILQMIVERRGQVDVLDYAKRIHGWMMHGFQELGDKRGVGMGMTTARTLTHPNFLSDPQACAREVWEASQRYLAPNGAVMRTSILGVLNFNDLPKVVANTTEICKVTHADPRCAASCIAVTTAIAMILAGQHDPLKRDGLNDIMEAALGEAEKVLVDEEHKKELRKYANASLNGMKLDEMRTIGYTYKAFGAGFYGLRMAGKNSFREIINAVIMEAGDADSNAAVCGAVTGCVVGFKSLPEDLLQFPHRAWLDQHVDSFLTTIGLKD